MKNILLICSFYLCYVAITCLHAASSSEITTPSMDASVESNLIDKIASIQYADIDFKIRTLDKIQNQAQNLGYISPAVQSNYYACATKIYSDLLATTNASFLTKIRKFIGIMRNSLSSQILDAYQKNIIRSYIDQLNQQCKSLTTGTQKTIVKGKQKAVQTRPGRVR